MITEDGIRVYGAPVDQGAVSQIRTCLKDQDAVTGALMADHHLGYSMPIGGVIAYKDAISPSGVGFDIACGNKAVRLELPGRAIRGQMSKIMDRIWKQISFGIGRINDERVDHELFDDPAWKINPYGALKEMARAQLGTVGSGNHYVDIFLDEQDRVWVGVHFGSRGLGHRIATHALKEAGGKEGMNVPATVLRKGSALFDDYLAGMHLAGRYAYAGRDWVAAKVAKILDAPIVEEIHNHHNFAWEETHNGETLWVVRKGATPAFPGQRGFVGGSMGDISVILEGVESEASRDILYSTVHGAGRIMSRTEAAGKPRRDGSRSGGKISVEAMLNRVKKRGVELRGAGTDEAPQVYRQLQDVLDAHQGTINILHTLTPVGVAMAGADTVDPYKD